MKRTTSVWGAAIVAMAAGCGAPEVAEDGWQPALAERSDDCINVSGRVLSLDEPDGFSCADVEDTLPGTYFCSLVMLTGDLAGCGEYMEYGGMWEDPHFWHYTGTTRVRLGEVTLTDVDGGQDCRESDSDAPLLYLDEDSVFNETSFTYIGDVSVRNEAGEVVGSLTWAGVVASPVEQGTYHGVYCP